MTSVALSQSGTYCFSLAVPLGNTCPAAALPSSLALWSVPCMEGQGLCWWASLRIRGWIKGKHFQASCSLTYLHRIQLCGICGISGLTLHGCFHGLRALYMASLFLQHYDQCPSYCFCFHILLSCV